MRHDDVGTAWQCWLNFRHLQAIYNTFSPKTPPTNRNSFFNKYFINKCMGIVMRSNLWGRGGLPIATFHIYCSIYAFSWNIYFQILKEHCCITVVIKVISLIIPSCYRISNLPDFPTTSQKELLTLPQVFKTHSISIRRPWQPKSSTLKRKNGWAGTSHQFPHGYWNHAAVMRQEVLWGFFTSYGGSFDSTQI